MINIIELRNYRDWTICEGPADKILDRELSDQS